MGKVLVAGDAMLDRYWLGTVDRLSPEAPVPVIHVKQYEVRLGGAANVATNCHSMGADTSLTCVIGHDADGELLENLCTSSGIRINPKYEGRTIVKLRLIGRSQQMLRADFEEITTTQLTVTDPDSYDVIVMSDYVKGSLLEPSRIMNDCRGKMILVDTKTRDYSKFANCYLLKQNVPDLQSAVGGWKTEAELEAKCQSIRRAINAKAILITKASSGMSLYSDTTIHIPAQAKEVFDVTGAGDTVMAGLAVMLSEGKSLEHAVRFANKAAGIAVGKFGTSVVTRAEAE